MLDLQVEIFILVGIGYLISKLGLFNKQTRKQVTDLVLNIVLPVATAKSFLIKLTPSIMKTTLVVFLVSIGIQGLYFIINKTAYNNQKNKEDQRYSMRLWYLMQVLWVCHLRRGYMVIWVYFMLVFI